MSTRIEADYVFETALDPLSVAEAMAGEQSSGTFVPVPGETAALKARSAARVEKLEIMGEATSAALPGAYVGEGRFLRVKTTLSWPLENCGVSLPNLMATVAGNLFELKQVSALRLQDIRLPAAFAQKYHGPKFGIAGTRAFSNIYHRPLIGSIIKPSIGFSPQETAQLVQTLCEAGIDFIKDDELQANGSHCPFDERVKAVMAVINRHADKTGKKIMFAFNVTGDLDEMRYHHDVVLANKGTCVMASLNSVGVVGMLELARHTQLPLHGHRNGWGYLSRHPALGWSYVAWQKIWRLIGVDHLHVNGLQSKFFEADASVMLSAQTCLTPLFSEKPCLVMPVFSSGQTAAQAKATIEGLRSPDLIVTAGGGVMAHEGGAEAGVKALREAYEAALKGISA